jgi:hypothetical protein
MFDDNNRYARDDLIPGLRDDGVVTTIAPWLKFNISEGFLIEAIQTQHKTILQTGQLRQLIADLVHVGALEGGEIAGFPTPIERPATPSGIGCGNGNVWVTPPSSPYVLRFYVNGVYKMTQADYYITDLVTLGAVSGDTIQVCSISPEGIVGWWASIKVPFVVPD